MCILPGEKLLCTPKEVLPMPHFPTPVVPAKLCAEGWGLPADEIFFRALFVRQSYCEQKKWNLALRVYSELHVTAGTWTGGTPRLPM